MDLSRKRISKRFTRLLWGEKGAQDAIVEALFRAYFTEGRDVDELSVLIDIAVEVGINKARATSFLESAAGTDEVRLEEQGAMASGISGVPAFILDGELLFPGALKPELMVTRFREAAQSNAQR
jgi:predicted DsbA family dithiol-disulfide isomerase